jgi:UDP-N-acetylmuramoyl-tripeptide--D-alanyl-D-alanine ligase
MGARTSARVVTYGDAGEVRAVSLELDEALRATFRLETPWGAVERVRLSVRGRHQAENALAAAAAALALEVPLDAVAEALADASLSPGRMHLRPAHDGGLVLDDSYNANPESMAAALRSLAEIPARTHRAVLGPMAELGATSEADHQAITSLAASLGVEVIAYRTDAYGAAVRVDEPGAVAERLAPVARDVAVLVKGSRVAALEQVVDLLVTDR